MDKAEPIANALPTDEAVAEFVAQNPELMEALEVFGIASEEYERAIRALYPVSTYTSSSTHELLPQ